MERIGHAAPKKKRHGSLSKESILGGIFGRSSFHVCDGTLKPPPIKLELILRRMVTNAGLDTQFFNLWLKTEKYSVVLVNTIPTAGSALQVILH